MAKYITRSEVTQRGFLKNPPERAFQKNLPGSKNTLRNEAYCPEETTFITNAFGQHDMCVPDRWLPFYSEDSRDCAWDGCENEPGGCQLVNTIYGSFYYFGEITLDGNTIDPIENCIPVAEHYASSSDPCSNCCWVISAFNPGHQTGAMDSAGNLVDTLVGVQNWDISNCGGGICEMKVQGYQAPEQFGAMFCECWPMFWIYQMWDVMGYGWYYEPYSGDPNDPCLPSLNIDIYNAEYADSEYCYGNEESVPPFETCLEEGMIPSFCTESCWGDYTHNYMHVGQRPTFKLWNPNEGYAGKHYSGVLPTSNGEFFPSGAAFQQMQIFGHLELAAYDCFDDETCMTSIPFDSDNIMTWLSAMGDCENTGVDNCDDNTASQCFVCHGCDICNEGEPCECWGLFDLWDSGCMDETACNYDANAILDDGTCAVYDAMNQCGGTCCGISQYCGAGSGSWLEQWCIDEGITDPTTCNETYLNNTDNHCAWNDYCVEFRVNGVCVCDEGHVEINGQCVIDCLLGTTLNEYGACVPDIGGACTHADHYTNGYCNEDYGWEEGDECIWNNCGHCVVPGSEQDQKCGQSACNPDWWNTVFELQALDDCGDCSWLPEIEWAQTSPNAWNHAMDDCGVCDGPGAVYECGCFGIGVWSCITLYEEGEPEWGQANSVCTHLDNQPSCTNAGDDFRCAYVQTCDCNGTLSDECGVCDGPGAEYECWGGIMRCNESDCPVIECIGEVTTCFTQPDCINSCLEICLETDIDGNCTNNYGVEYCNNVYCQDLFGTGSFGVCLGEMVGEVTTSTIGIPGFIAGAMGQMITNTPYYCHEDQQALLYCNDVSDCPGNVGDRGDTGGGRGRGRSLTKSQRKRLIDDILKGN